MVSRISKISTLNKIIFKTTKRTHFKENAKNLKEERQAWDGLHTNQWLRHLEPIGNYSNANDCTFSASNSGLLSVSSNSNTIIPHTAGNKAQPQLLWKWSSLYPPDIRIPEKARAHLLGSNTELVTCSLSAWNLA